MPTYQHLIGLALLGAGALIASPVNYVEGDLQELARLLEEANGKAPALVAQSIAKEESVARLDAAKANYWPRLDLGGNFGFTQTSYTSSNYQDEQNVGAGFNATITRPLYHWGAIEALIQQARLDFDNEELQRVFILRQVKRSLRADYLSLLVNQASLDNLRLRRQITEDGLASTRSDKEQGSVSANAAEQAKLDLGQRLIDIEQVEEEQKRIVEDYKRNLGWEAPLRLDQPVPKPNVDAVISWGDQIRAEGQDAWVFDHAEVRRRQNLIAREKQELIRVKSNQRPLFNLTASAGQTQQNTAAANNVDALTYFVGIGVSWNVFDGFATAAKKRETLLRERRLERQLGAYRAELLSQSTHLVRQIGFIARQLQIDQRRGDLATQAFNVQKRDAEEGRISPQTLRSLQLGYNETQLTALRTRVRLIMGINDYLDLTLPVAIDYPKL